MQPFYPGATQIIFEGPSGGSYTGGPFRGVLHTTQAKYFHPSTKSYYGHSNPPHFTVAMIGDRAHTFQHFSIKTASRALKNKAGGVQTNRQSAIQIEIAWTAEDIGNLPADVYAELQALIGWINAECQISTAYPPFFDDAGYGYGSVSRMSAAEWQSFNGWCGHQHVPENLHWDPGLIDIDRALPQLLVAQAAQQ